MSSRLLVAAFLVAGCAKEPAESPSAAWVEAVASLQNGDAQRLQKVIHTTDAKVQQLVVAVVGALGDLLRLSDAAAQRWGDKATEVTEVRTKLAKGLVPSDSPSGELSIDGDRATMMMKSGKTQPFIKVRGGWKFDLDGAHFFRSDEQVTKVQATFAGMQTCLQSATDKVKNDQALSPGDATTEMQRCMAPLFSLMVMGMGGK